MVRSLSVSANLTTKLEEAPWVGKKERKKKGKKSDEGTNSHLTAYSPHTYTQQMNVVHTYMQKALRKFAFMINYTFRDSCEPTL